MGLSPIEGSNPSLSANLLDTAPHHSASSSRFACGRYDGRQRAGAARALVLAGYAFIAAQGEVFSRFLIGGLAAAFRVGGNRRRRPRRGRPTTGAGGSALIGRPGRIPRGFGSGS